MKEKLNKLISSKNLVISDYVIKVAVKEKISLNEFLVLSYFVNSYHNNFEIELISELLGISKEEVMEAFNSLMVKGLVSLETVKDSESRLNEIVNLNGLYSKVLDDIEVSTNNKKKDDIFKTFEKELGRTMSSMELEIINEWLMKGFSEEIILGALKEAVYNDVRQFRYIDKIIYEWDRKGFKTMEDVNSYLKNRRSDNGKVISKKELEISEIDWLDD